MRDLLEKYMPEGTFNLKNFEDYMNEIRIRALKKDVWAILHIDDKNLTEELCIAAVTENGVVLKYIQKRATDNVCIAALDSNKFTDRLGKKLMKDDVVENLYDSNAIKICRKYAINDIRFSTTKRHLIHENFIL